jgi:hypothetical protein
MRTYNPVPARTVIETRQSGKHHRAWSVLLLLIAACTNSNNADTPNGSVDAAHDGTLGDCPPKASTCPSSCYPILGREVDAANNCFLPAEPVACWLGTSGANAQFGCIQDPDTGAQYVVGSTTYIKDLVDSGKWGGCTTSVTQPCP